MRGVSSGCNNAAAQNFRDNLRRFASAVHPVIRELIGGQSLCVKRAEAGFVTKEWAAGHGHTSRQEDFDGRIQPQDGDSGSAHKFGAAWLRVCAAPQGENRALFQFGSAAKNSTQLIRFDLTKCGLAEACENFRKGKAG